MSSVDFLRKRTSKLTMEPVDVPPPLIMIMHTKFSMHGMVRINRINPFF
jgi:hypothetical protein